MTELIAKKSFTYAGRALNKGDRFTVRNHADVRVLLAVNLAMQPFLQPGHIPPAAMPAPAPPPPWPGTAEAQTEIVAQTHGQYQRRDMQAKKD